MESGSGKTAAWRFGWAIIIILGSVTSQQALAERSWEEENSAKEDWIVSQPNSGACFEAKDCIAVAKLCSNRWYVINHRTFDIWKNGEAEMARKKGSKITCTGEIAFGHPKADCIMRTCRIVN